MHERVAGHVEGQPGVLKGHSACGRAIWYFKGWLDMWEGHREWHGRLGREP